MGLFGNNQSQQSLMPNGLSNGQQQMLGNVANAAQSSGLSAMAGQAAMGQIDAMTNGMNNEDQVALLYRLMAAHPNQVALFMLSYPQFMAEFANLLSLIVKKELYAFFKSGALVSATERGGAYTVNSEAGDYASITQENIDMQISKVVPLQQMQMQVSQADMNAMQMMGGHQQNMMMNQMQQQQMMQQQMMQQQMMGQPQRAGMGAALGGFGASLIRGSLGLPPAQQAPMQQGMTQPGMQGGF